MNMTSETTNRQSTPTCPACGWEVEEFGYGSLTLCFLVEKGTYYFLGMQGHKWDELHRCPECGCKFSFENSDL